MASMLSLSKGYFIPQRHFSWSTRAQALIPYVVEQTVGFINGMAQEANALWLLRVLVSALTISSLVS